MIANLPHFETPCRQFTSGSQIVANLPPKRDTGHSTANLPPPDDVTSYSGSVQPYHLHVGSTGMVTVPADWIRTTTSTTYMYPRTGSVPVQYIRIARSSTGSRTSTCVRIDSTGRPTSTASIDLDTGT